MSSVIMTGAIMQSYFFPYLGYFQLIDQVDEFILYEYVTFRKQSWMTRNRLLKKGLGQEFVVNIPVEGSSSFKLINEIKISDSKPWKRTFLKFIHHNYAKAQYFDNTFSLIQSCLGFENSSLHQFNSHCIKSICQYIGIKTKIISENVDLYTLETGLSQRAQEHQLSVKTQRIIEICQARGWHTYLNPEGGTEIYNKADFENSGISLKFWKSELPSYFQFSTKFHPGLSILDVLMHVGPAGVKDMLHAGNFF